MIKIAYDISVLGNYFSRPDAKTGIYRVAEEVLNRLVSQPGIDLTLVGLCGESPAYTSIGCLHYFRERKELIDSVASVKFLETYQSKLRLNWLYRRLHDRYFSKEFQKLPKYSKESVLIRGSLSLLDKSRFIHADVSRRFTPDKFDLLHSTYYSLPPFELTQGIPRLITIYDLIPLISKEYVNPSLNSYFKSLLNSINHQKDWVVCISEYTRQEFCEHTGFPSERTFVTQLAADQIFTPVGERAVIETARQRYRIPESDYFLCLASHLDPRKNIFHLIKSFINLIRENPTVDANLVLIGTLRFEREDLTKAAQAFEEFRDRVILAGYVPDEDLSALYNGSIAFVFPSLYEGFGLPILEAMQSGTPVISSNVTSLPEVAGDAAILVDPKSEDELSQAMLTLLRDKQMRDRLVEKGLARARQFSWDKCASETVDIYQAIAANP